MKRINRTLHILLCALFLLLNTNIIAQHNCSFTLSGITKEEHKPEPLSYAVIHVLELDTVITSDDEGHYIIEKLCKGNYTLICSFLGFRTDTQTIFLDKSKGVFFNLHPENCELDEVVVNASTTVEYRTIEPVAVMAVRRTELIIQTNHTSTGLITRNISGGSSLNTGSNTAKPVFHGLHSNRLKVIQNGIPIENQQWGAEHGLDLGDFENPTMSNSPYAYHDAIGGVLTSYSNVGAGYLEDWKDYKNGEDYYYIDHSIYGKVNSEFNSNGQSNISSGFLTGNLKNAPYIGWKVFGGYGRGGDVESPKYNLKNTGFSNYNYGYQSRINLGRIEADVYYQNVFQQSGIFTGSHIGNTTDFYKAVNSNAPDSVHTGDFSYTIGGPFQQINHEMITGHLRYSNSEDSRNYDLRYSRQYNKREEFDVHDLENADLHLELTSHHLNGSVRFNLDSGSYDKLGWIGFSSMYQKNTWKNSQFVPNYLKKKAGVFIGFEKRNLFKKYNSYLRSNLLYDIDQTDVYRLENRIVSNENLLFHAPALNIELTTSSKGKRVKIDGTTYINANTYKLGLASTWRAPAINELYSGGVHHSAASLEFGNPDLKRENSYKMYVTIQRPTRKYDFSTTLHSNLFQNYIYSAPTGEVLLTLKGAFPAFTYNQTNALLSGFDFDFHYNWSNHLSSLTKSTFIHAYDFQKNNGLIGIPANRLEQSVTYNFSKKINTSGLFATMGSSYFMKQYNSNLNFELVTPPKGYLLFDADLKYRMKINSKLDDYWFMTFKIEVNNILNTQYRDYMNRYRFFADEMGRNFKLSIEIPFHIIKKEITN